MRFFTGMPWKYRMPLIMIAFHGFVVIALFLVPQPDRLIILEMPVVWALMVLGTLVPPIMRFIFWVMEVLPQHPAALRGALNPGSILMTALVWGLCGYALGKWVDSSGARKFFSDLLPPIR